MIDKGGRSIVVDITIQVANLLAARLLQPLRDLLMTVLTEAEFQQLTRTGRVTARAQEAQVQRMQELMRQAQFALPLRHLGFSIDFAPVASGPPKKTVPEPVTGPIPGPRPQPGPKPTPEPDPKPGNGGGQPDTGGPGEGTPYTVVGSVWYQGRGVAGVRVVAWDRNVGKDSRLGQADTDAQGDYEIRFAWPSSGPKPRPDIVVMAYDTSGEVHAVSPVQFDAEPESRSDLHLERMPAAGGRLTSEFEGLHQALDAVLMTQRERPRLAELQEDATHHDITYLAQKARWDARAVAMAALADRFSDAAGVAPEFFYALFRAGVPADEQTLASSDPQAFVAVWNQAVEDGVIPAHLRGEIPKAAESLAAYGTEQMLFGAVHVGVSALGDLLDVALPGDTACKRQVAALYTQHRGDTQRFWQAVRTQMGENVAQSLELNGRLSALTVNNAPLVKALREGLQVSSPLDLVRRGLFRTEDWAPHLAQVPVPDEMPGEGDAERRANYASFLAEQLRLSYPTAVVAERVRAGEIPLSSSKAQADVYRFLSETQGRFELGANPVQPFLERERLRLDPESVSQLKALQRAYQLSPSDQALAGLLREGLDSAYSITQRSEDEFVERYAANLGGVQSARLVYAKAHQVHHTAINVATSYMLQRSAPAVYAISGEAGEAPVGDVLGYPTLEGLFGAMDYCACEHCRSVLSPAAYLVDLLQFLDKAVPEGPSPLDVLLQRRPDIEHIELTCANTNVAMPHIDLVNEVLEYFVARGGSLAGFEGHNTSDEMTSAELMANPAFVNDTAYERLRDAIRPLDLPFHRPLEALRRYFEHFDLPLHQALADLRPSERLVPTTGSPPDAYGWRDICLERLGISRRLYAALTDSRLPLPVLFGEDPKRVSEAELVARLTNARTLPRSMGVTYEELLEIVSVPFIGPLALADPAGDEGICRFDTLELRTQAGQPLAASAFRKLFRFVRLWRCLGWSIELTGKALQALDPASCVGADDSATDAAFDTLLMRLAALVAVMDELDVRPGRELLPLLALWAPIDTHGRHSLYRRMFLHPDILRITPVFEADAGGQFLSGDERLLDHTAALRAAFSLTQGELDRIVAALGFVDDTPLTLGHISQMFRYGYLARRLELSVEELLEVIALSGLDPFAPLDGSAAASPEHYREPDLLQLIRWLKGVRESGFGVGRWLYHLAHRDPSGTASPSAGEVAALAIRVRSDLAEAEREIAFLEPVSEEGVQAQMAQVYGQAAADTFFGILRGAQDETDLFFDRFPDLAAQVADYAASGLTVSEWLPRFQDALRAIQLPRLKHRRVLHALGAQSGADLPILQALLSTPEVLHAAGDTTKSALADFLALEAGGLSVRVQGVAQPSGAPFQAVDDPAAVHYRPGGTPIPSDPAAPGGPVRGEWYGYLRVPDDAAYRLVVEADAGAEVTCEVGRAPLALTREGGEWLSDSIELRAGRLYPIRLHAHGVHSRLVLRWGSTGLGREPIPPRYLYPAESFERFAATYVRLLKAVDMAQALRLSPAELTHFATRHDLQVGGAGWLGSLPVRRSATAGRELHGALATLIRYALLRAEMQADGDRLVQVLADPHTQVEGELLIDRLTGWEAADRLAFMRHFGLTGTDLTRVEALERLHRAMRIAKALGVGATTLLTGATNEPSGDTERNLRAALLARYGETDRLDLLRPIHDSLRKRQRDALVAYVLGRFQQDPQAAHIDTADKLFEFFLIDVEVEPCMATSRIRQATAAVQLFVQRCMLGLEPRVDAAALSAAQWDWMKRYRVWEANRKVFLYPENWLEPELRPDKSPFFEELETEIFESDFTDEAAADALVHYLEKLSEVAKLEVCAMHIENRHPAAPGGDVVHVIARTPGAGAKYFYRRLEGSYWTPWQRVDLDIEETPVCLVVWEGRLYLFWLSLLRRGATQSPIPATGDTPLANLTPSSLQGEVFVSVSATLYWSEFYHNKWHPVKTSSLDEPIELGDYPETGLTAFRRSFVSLKPEVTAAGLDVVIRSYGGAHWRMRFEQAHSSPWMLPETGELSPGERRLTFTNVQFGAQYRHGTGRWASRSILTRAPMVWAVQHGAGGRVEPFFLQDRRYAFYVRSKEQSITIREWDDLWRPPIIQLPGPLLPDGSIFVDEPIFTLPDIPGRGPINPFGPLGPILTGSGGGIVNPGMPGVIGTPGASGTPGVIGMPGVVGTPAVDMRNILPAQQTIRYGNVQIGAFGVQPELHSAPGAQQFTTLRRDVR